MKKLRNIFALIAVAAAAWTFTGCNDTKSYAERLADETKYINAFLADQRVVGHVPADSVFEVGPNAPYYRLDEDGNVYMQVFKTGDLEDKAKYNAAVYVRFNRYNLEKYDPQGYKYNDEKLTNGCVPGFPEFDPNSGNAADVTYSEVFRYQNFSSSSSYQWGESIQVPLQFLGYGCEVNLVIRSANSRTDEIANVIPYVYRVRYYKSHI